MGIIGISSNKHSSRRLDRFECLANQVVYKKNVAVPVHIIAKAASKAAEITDVPSY